MDLLTGLLIFVLLCLIIIFVILIVKYGFFLDFGGKKYIRRNGIRGTAKLLSLKYYITSDMANSRIFRTSSVYYKFILKFRVTIPGREPYDIVKKVRLTHAVPGLFKTGNEYAVSVHPKFHKNVLLRDFNF